MSSAYARQTSPAPGEAVAERHGLRGLDAAVAGHEAGLRGDRAGRDRAVDRAVLLLGRRRLEAADQRDGVRQRALRHGGVGRQHGAGATSSAKAARRRSARRRRRLRADAVRRSPPAAMSTPSSEISQTCLTGAGLSSRAGRAGRGRRSSSLPGVRRRSPAVGAARRVGGHGRVVARGASAEPPSVDVVGSRSSSLVASPAAPSPRRERPASTSRRRTRGPAAALSGPGHGDAPSSAPNASTPAAATAATRGRPSASAAGGSEAHAGRGLAAAPACGGAAVAARARERIEPRRARRAPHSRQYRWSPRERRAAARAGLAGRRAASGRSGRAEIVIRGRSCGIRARVM